MELNLNLDLYVGIECALFEDLGPMCTIHRPGPCIYLNLGPVVTLMTWVPWSP